MKRMFLPFEKNMYRRYFYCVREKAMRSSPIEITLEAG
jgi:hypothetical protein